MQLDMGYTSSATNVAKVGEGVPLEELQEEDFLPKWYLNGFPKSGLHWVALMMLPIADPMFDEHNLWNQPWAGTFTMNSWTTRMVPINRVTYKIGRLKDGYFLKGHSAHIPTLEDFLWFFGASVIFIYRDLRDVAVSQAFHVLSDDDVKMAHPNKDLYKNMDSFEDVLKAVISGVDIYPGVMERWNHYAPWMDVSWVCHISFEELKRDTKATAVKILKYGVNRTSRIFGLAPQTVDEGIDTVSDWMVTAGKQTDQSPTFRKGAVGDWQEYFTPEIAKLFAETDTENWLTRLHYVEGDDWWKK